MRGSAGTGSAPELLDDDAARAFFEHFRWPNGPVCPHCGSLGAYRLHPRARSTAPVRKGVLKCKACRRQFTVTIGTAFEHSHISLSWWLAVIRRLCESGPALSAYRLHKLVGVSRQSAWLMAQRIRLGNRAAPPPTSGAPIREPAAVTRKSRLGGRKAAEPTASAMPAAKLSLAGLAYEEVLASMMRRKPPATVKARAKVKRGTEKYQTGNPVGLQSVG